MTDSVYHTACWVGCTHLVVVRRGYEYNGPLARNVECTARPDFSEEDVGDHSPEDERGIIDEVGFVFVFVCNVHGWVRRSRKPSRESERWYEVESTKSASSAMTSIMCRRVHHATLSGF